jgi:hypothetical protein
MSQQEPLTPDEPQVPVANNDWSGIELTQEVIIALADYLDVFVAMDLELKQRKENNYGVNQDSSTSS